MPRHGPGVAAGGVRGPAGGASASSRCASDTAVESLHQPNRASLVMGWANWVIGGLARGLRWHLVTLMDAAILNRDLEPFRQRGRRGSRSSRSPPCP
jgi:hypothetical protein